MGTSPLPMKRRDDPPADMDFGEALQAAKDGKKIRRREWPEDHYGYFRADILHIHRVTPGVDGSDHRWIVSSGDVDAADWVLA